jgi:hypothetical protein
VKNWDFDLEFVVERLFSVSMRIVWGWDIVLTVKSKNMTSPKGILIVKISELALLYIKYVRSRNNVPLELRQYSTSSRL